MEEKLRIKNQEQLIEILAWEDLEIPDEDFSKAVEKMNDYLVSIEYEDEDEALHQLNIQIAEYVFTVYSNLFITSENKITGEKDGSEILIFDGGEDSKAYRDFVVFVQ